MKNLCYLFILCLSAGISSCQSQQGPAQSTNTTLSVDEYEKKLTEQKDVQLIDVRTPEEFAQGHLKGAINYDFRSKDFENQIQKLDKTKPVMVYCLSGGRSSSAAQVLGEKGFSEVYNMKGGIMKWNAENKPLENGTAGPSSPGISMKDFTHLLNSSKFVLVDFNAKWCAPCKRMAPMLAAFTEKRKENLSLVKIDADDNKALLKEKNIEGLPVLELYKEGILVWKHEGEIDEAGLLEAAKPQGL
jgi:thioredoxin 1